MSDPRLRLTDISQVQPTESHPLFGRVLMDAGIISHDDLSHALSVQKKVDARLGEILVAEGLASENDILYALALQNSSDRVDLSVDPPDVSMAYALPADTCLRNEIVPWRWLGDTLMVATTKPQDIRHLRDRLGDLAPPILPVVAPTAQIHTHLGRLYGDRIAKKAVTRVPEAESARKWSEQSPTRSGFAAAIILALFAAVLLAPVPTFTVFLAWGVLTLVLTSSLKCVAFFAQVRHLYLHPDVPLPDELPFRMPRVSVIVPLYKEKEIAGELIKRLERLTYPKSLLNVLLVLEAKDHVTRKTIARTKLPQWISVLEVPDDGTITTKPRALNYALEFCHGSIVGVWDAEDAPDPDQIEKVVMHFHAADENVACLQGQLDYYNARRNWIARCFAIEYAAWWRFVMPGTSRLSIPIPLGGTTLFFRRHVLEKLEGWDAHNVTEDADLGIRLARHGYKTEVLNTVTMEEANCRAWPWVRQRSRWLKGFLVTYLVHMRQPRALIRDLGWTGFLGLQIILFATFSQFAALPILWTFWFPLLGLPHVLGDILTPMALLYFGIFFFASEFLNVVIGMASVSSRQHRHLMPWVITMPLYFMMGSLAAYKAIYEMIVAPFYWDKTEHGVK